MTKLWRLVPTFLSIVFFLSFLPGCATTEESFEAKPSPQLILQRRVATWLGMPREMLEKHWGLAKSTKDMGMGLRYLTYKAKGKTKDVCSVVFTIDITNTVKGGNWSGDNASCLRFLKEVPPIHQPQQLVSLP